MEWLLKKSGFATQAEAPAIIRNNGGSGHQSSTGLLVGVGVGGGGISASISSPVKLTGQDLAIE